MVEKSLSSFVAGTETRFAARSIEKYHGTREEFKCFPPWAKLFAELPIFRPADFCRVQDPRLARLTVPFGCLFFEALTSRWRRKCRSQPSTSGRGSRETLGEHYSANFTAADFFPPSDDFHGLPSSLASGNTMLSSTDWEQKCLGGTSCWNSSGEFAI